MRVTREQLEDLFDESRWIEDLIDNILALINGKKEWCEHCYRNGLDERFWMCDHQGGTITVQPEWTVCPICGAKKPK